MTVLQVILTLLLPPVAVALRYGLISSAFFISLILTLLGRLPGVIHAFVILSRPGKIK